YDKGSNTTNPTATMAEVIRLAEKGDNQNHMKANMNRRKDTRDPELKKIGSPYYYAIRKGLATIKDLADGTRIFPVSCNPAYTHFLLCIKCLHLPEFKQLWTNVSLKDADVWPAEPQESYGLEKLETKKLCRNYTKDFGIECRVSRMDSSLQDPCRVSSQPVGNNTTYPKDIFDVQIHNIDDVAEFFGVPLNTLKDIEDLVQDLQLGKHAIWPLLFKEKGQEITDIVCNRYAFVTPPNGA
ncbi:hypothetical protein Tco_1185422, partial [Tanacetum coccineum]